MAQETRKIRFFNFPVIPATKSVCMRNFMFLGILLVWEHYDWQHPRRHRLKNALENKNLKMLYLENEESFLKFGTLVQFHDTIFFGKFRVSNYTGCWVTGCRKIAIIFPVYMVGSTNLAGALPRTIIKKNQGKTKNKEKCILELAARIRISHQSPCGKTKVQFCWLVLFYDDSRGRVSRNNNITYTKLYFLIIT